MIIGVIYVVGLMLWMIGVGYVAYLYDMDTDSAVGATISGALWPVTLWFLIGVLGAKWWEKRQRTKAQGGQDG